MALISAIFFCKQEENTRLLSQMLASKYERYMSQKQTRFELHGVQYQRVSRAQSGPSPRAEEEPEQMRGVQPTGVLGTSLECALCVS